jgi:hypothetical protein
MDCGAAMAAMRADAVMAAVVARAAGVVPAAAVAAAAAAMTAAACKARRSDQRGRGNRRSAQDEPRFMHGFSLFGFCRARTSPNAGELMLNGTFRIGAPGQKRTPRAAFAGRGARDLRRGSVRF